MRDAIKSNKSLLKLAIIMYVFVGAEFICYNSINKVEEQKMSDNFIGVRPNLKDWAEAVYNGTINGANKKRTILWLEEELKDIANKYYLMGFEDGDKDGWWKEQEACKHKYNSDYALFCTKCGEEALS